MTNANTIHVETAFDVMRDNYANGRQFGKIRNDIDILQWEMYFRSPSAQEAYEADIRRAAEEMEMIPEPTNLVGLVAFEVGKIIG